MKKYLILLGLLLSTLGCYADEKPSFPGGTEALQKYLSANTKYPQNAIDNGVEGIVTVGFIVTVDGALREIKVVRFVDPDLEKEAIRIVTAMPAWIPAEKNGIPFEAPSNVEVPFILE